MKNDQILILLLTIIIFQHFLYLYVKKNITKRMQNFNIINVEPESFSPFSYIVFIFTYKAMQIVKQQCTHVSLEAFYSVDFR